MALILEWTEEAENQLEVIVKYLEENWSQTEVRNFLLKLETGLEIICNNPLQQKKSMRKPNAYEYQLAPQTTIFYEFDQQVLTIMLLWSNRMDPESLR